jgi:tetratricopeptide (TPR) repeat protein
MLMTKFIRRATMAALLSTASAIAVTAFIPDHAAFAAAAAAKKEPPGPTVRTAIGKTLNDAMKLIDTKDFAGALAKVQEADKTADKTPFEEYQVAKYLGFIEINQPMPDYAAAAKAYNREIASGGAPDAEKATMYNVGMRLNYQAMDFPNVIKDAAELQKLQPLDDTGYLILIQSYYNSNDFANAATTAKTEIAARTASGMKPSEDVLGLLLNSEIKTKDEAGARQALDQLAMVSAKPEIWGQVMDFALGTMGITDHQLLNLYRLSVLTGTMKDTDFAAMATIDLQNGLPKEAIMVLTKGNKSGELLTQANDLVARDEQSLPALAAEAAKQMNGEVDVKLGESYFTYGRYDDAIAALQKGIDKGGLKDTADAQTTLGIALLAAGKKDQAVAAFEKAAATQGAAGQVAHVWTLFGKRAV